MSAMLEIVTLRVEAEEGGPTDLKWEFTAPSSWRRDSQLSNKIAYAAKTGLDGFVMVTAAFNGDVAYIHASISKRGSIPTYEDLCELKRIVFGEHRYAALVFPPKSYHVNIHQGCLHLWGALNPSEWPLPEFSRGMGTI